MKRERSSPGRAETPCGSGLSPERSPQGHAKPLVVYRTMTGRDDFNQETKKIVAGRASWQCSFPGCNRGVLVGPSEESSTALSNLGDLAHICGAASGPGSRRYDPTMTPEERRSPDNAIFMCATHARMIDRDAESFTADSLRAMRRAHEQRCKREHQTGTGLDVGAALLAIGPNLICTGDLAEVAASHWTLRLKQFVGGDLHKLVSYIDRFAATAPGKRYVLSNELGDGRSLLAAPVLTREPDGLRLLCQVAPAAPRIDAQQLPADIALSSDTNDFGLDSTGDIAMVSGLAALPQMVKIQLSFQQHESPFHPEAGMRFFEYFEAYKGTCWLPEILQLDVIRQAAIPYVDGTMGRQYTPLHCVTRVCSVELLSETPEQNRLPMRLTFEVQGVGHWQHEVKIYMPTRAQLTKSAELRAGMEELLFDTGA